MNAFIIIIVAFFILLFRNFVFSILVAPVVYLYFKHKSRQYKVEAAVSLRNENDNISLPNRSLRSFVPSFFDYYLFRVSLTPSHHIRSFIYKRVCGMGIAKDVVIYHGAEIRNPHRITIGQGSIIGDNAVLDGRNGITIGNNVVFSSNVSIWTEQHDHRDPLFRCETQEKKPVVIDDRAWIGPNTIILHSVHIGEGAVVAAGAVVTHDVAPFAIVAGIPAKKIGEIYHVLIYIFDVSHRLFI